MSNRKAPADHKSKKDAAEQLRDEARSDSVGTLARTITLSGRRGEVTVTVLEDPMDWGIDASDLMGVWQARDPQSGGITAPELHRFLCAIVSVEDADRIRAIEPTRGSLSAAADAILDDSSSEPSLGESQAS